MRLTLNITRFDPQTDDKPYCREYTVDWERHETVLDLLLKTRREDPSLAFRRSCRSGICGSCAHAHRGSFPTGLPDAGPGDGRATGSSLSIKPLPGFRQLKDLVVDMDPFFDALKRVLPWVITVPHHDGLISPEDSARIEPPGHLHPVRRLRRRGTAERDRYPRRPGEKRAAGGGSPRRPGDAANEDSPA